MRVLIGLSVLLASSPVFAQDQQVGARAKALGGGYTAFEDDPVSIWINPGGIATQSNAIALDYQSFTIYELKASQSTFTTTGKMGWSEPAIVPSYLGAVFQLGEGDAEHAIGICFTAPFKTEYSFFNPDSGTVLDMKQSYYRFRAAYSYDFKFKNRSEGGWLTHLSAGFGLDLGMTSTRVDQGFTGTFNDTGFGGGAGLLLGVFDNTTNFKVNLGLAYESTIRYNFSVTEAVIPLISWPNQINGGMTFYMLGGQPLRVTFDVQWIQWSNATDRSQVPGSPDFADSLNYSMGVEYRLRVSDKVSLYPRAGVRRFNPPWDHFRNLPAIGPHLLNIETSGDRFTVGSVGFGVSKLMESGRIWRVDVAVDFGGEAMGVAFGFTLEI